MQVLTIKINKYALKISEKKVLWELKINNSKLGGITKIVVNSNQLINYQMTKINYFGTN